MFKAVMAIVLGFIVFTGLMYYAMYKQADGFMVRIEREVLGTFDRRAGPASVNKPIQDIAAREKIALDPDDVEVRIVAVGGSRAAAAVGIAAPDSGGEAIEVTVSFDLNRSIFSQRFTRTARRELKGSSSRNQSYSSGGFSGGVNLSGPSRDVQSHRQTVDRAVRGQNE